MQTDTEKDSASLHPQPFAQRDSSFYKRPMLFDVPNAEKGGPQYLQLRIKAEEYGLGHWIKIVEIY